VVVLTPPLPRVRSLLEFMAKRRRFHRLDRYRR
jgi:hypothetical protein